MTKVSPSQSEQKKSKKMKHFFWFFLCVIIAGAVWYGISRLNAPVQGVVKETTEKYKIDASNIPPPIKQFNGDNFSMYLSETYEEKRHSVQATPGSPVLEQVFFTQMSGPGRKVAVTVERADANLAKNLSSYTFRMNSPKIYRRDTYEWDGKRITIFLKSDVVYEVVGYIESDDRVASLAVSSAVELPENLMSDFSDIVKTFEWGDMTSSTQKE